MQCPVCTDTKLVMTERQGVEIDYCPDCRGVWLDRGELDKIIERTAGDIDEPRGGPDPGSKKHDEGKGKHKRKTLLSELLDF